MSLNCWIIKSHTITFAGILNSTNQGKSLPSFLLCVYGAQKGNRKAHCLKKFSLMHLWSLLIYILFGEKQRWRSCRFPKCCMCVQAGLGFSFSVSFHFASFFLQRSSSSAPVDILEATFVGKYTVNSGEEIEVLRRCCTVQDVQWIFSGPFEGLKNLSFLAWGNSGRPWNLGPHSCAS